MILATMKGSDIAFNAKMRMSFRIAPQAESVLLELSDSLEAYEACEAGELSSAYKDRIARFLAAAETWYPLAIAEIRKRDPEPGKLRLLQVFVLSEEDAASIVFGLLFRVEIDVEHGRGLRIDGETMAILQYGIGDVAF